MENSSKTSTPISLNTTNATVDRGEPGSPFPPPPYGTNKTVRSENVGTLSYSNELRATFAPLLKVPPNTNF